MVMHWIYQAQRLFVQHRSCKELICMAEPLQRSCRKREFPKHTRQQIFTPHQFGSSLYVWNYLIWTFTVPKIKGNCTPKYVWNTDAVSKPKIMLPPKRVKIPGNWKWYVSIILDQLFQNENELATPEVGWRFQNTNSIHACVPGIMDISPTRMING